MYLLLYFLGLCCMTIYRLSEQNSSLFLWLVVFWQSVSSQLIRADYQWLGILLIMIFYIWQTSKLICYTAFITVTSVYCLTVMSWLQAASICALIPIYWYNGKKRKILVSICILFFLSSSFTNIIFYFFIVNNSAK